MATLDALLLSARRRLAASGSETAGLDARVLAAHLLGLEPSSLIARGGDPMDEAFAAALAALVDRRAKGEPVGRILGYREFHGHRLALSEETLEPRPDTETLVDFAIERVRRGRVPGAGPDGTGLLFVDVGTGSGAIAVAVAAALPGARGIATDISAGALRTAARNAADLGLADRLAFRQGSYLDPVAERVQMVLSNPPYIATGELSGLMPGVRDHDPALALDGGADGLDAYRALFPAAARRLVEGGTIAVEMGWTQGESVTALALENGFRHPHILSDLAGLDRVVAAERG